MNIRKYLARIKRRVLKKPFLKDPNFPPFWLNELLGGKDAYIVQIGSNDGKTGDPLYELLHQNQQWNALFVEPVPYIFKKLVANYPDFFRFKHENVAINQGENLAFFWVDPKAIDTLEDLPFWYDQLGSFDSTHIVSQLGDKIRPFIISESLEGITLETLLKRNEVARIDLLHIDTEGHDWKILSQLDLKKYSPSFILFEKNHLSSVELQELEDFLTDDYDLFEIGIDGFAVSKKVSDSIKQKMKMKLQTWN